MCLAVAGNSAVPAHAAPGTVEIGRAPDYLPMLGELKVAVLKVPGGADLVLTYLGGHVCSCRIGGQEILYMSPNSLSDGSALRGGSPVVGSWFGAKAGVPNILHGVLRTAQFEAQEQAQTVSGVATFSLNMLHNALTREHLGGGCAVTLETSLDAMGYTTTGIIDNTQGSMTISNGVFGFHDYILLPGLAQAEFYGLTGPYIDRSGKEEKRDRNNTSPLFLPEVEVNRLFLAPDMSPQKPLTITDPTAMTRINLWPLINLTQACWWHPAGRSNMSDLRPDQHGRFACLELLTAPQDIKPGDVF